MKGSTLLTTSVLAAGMALGSSAHADTLTANATAASNYIWRGLTQTENEAAISGGLDYTHDSGFYVGTWISNVNFGAGDPYSYENDIYGGFSKTVGDVTYNVGYMYYNYDKAANFDFGEVYGSVAVAGFTFKAASLVHTEADEAPGQDFGFAEQLYLSADYVIDAGNDIDVGLHVGYHDGEFMEAFNGVNGDYLDYGVSIAKSGFKFLISDTNVKGPVADGAFDNSQVKFVVSYTMNFEMF